MPVSEMHTICRHVPDNIPANKPGRVVVYGENFGIPCGGTHVKDIHQVGKVIISKLKEKKSVICVSYAVAGIGSEYTYNCRIDTISDITAPMLPTRLRHFARNVTNA